MSPCFGRNYEDSVNAVSNSSTYDLHFYSDFNSIPNLSLLSYCESYFTCSCSNREVSYPFFFTFQNKNLKRTLFSYISESTNWSGELQDVGAWLPCLNFIGAKCDDDPILFGALLVISSLSLPYHSFTPPNTPLFFLHDVVSAKLPWSSSSYFPPLLPHSSATNTSYNSYLVLSNTSAIIGPVLFAGFHFRRQVNFGKKYKKNV